MKGSRRSSTALFVVTLAIAAACTPQETVRISPSPSATPVTTAPATTAPATRSPSPAPASPTPSATRTPAPSASPGSSPSTACPTLTGGSPLAASLLTAIRAAHQPGFDRLVFEWSGPAVPQYEVKVASTFTAPSGQAVRVDGNAFISVRMTGQAHTDTPPATRSYTQPDPYRPGLPLIREAKLVEDFEGVVIFGVGLERLACPTVLTLRSPTRIVLDFPTPP